MKILKMFFIYLSVIFIVSFSLSLAYANSELTSASTTGIGLTQPFYYTNVDGDDLSSLLLNNSNGLNILDIRNKEVFEKAHLEAAEHFKPHELSNLLVNMSFNIAKPILIIGEDPVLNDFFAKMASFYGYEAYVFDDDLNALDSNVKLISSAEEYKDINQVDSQTVVEAARVAIDESTKALIELSQNLDNMINNNLVNTEALQNIINSIINQINRLRENPITGMFFPTDQSVGDVLLDTFLDDRRIRNRAHAEGVSDALNLVGGNISRLDQRRMSRNNRFERRQIIGTANDLKAEGYNEAVVDVLNIAGQRPSRLNQRLMDRSSLYQLIQVNRLFNNLNESTYNNAVAETLKLQGVDLNRRQVRRMDRNQIYQRRQVIGAANDLKGAGFNEGVTDTLRLMGIDLSRRDVRRMNRSERGQINAVSDAANSIKSQGYTSGYQAGYDAGYKAGVRQALLNSGLSSFRLARLERKQNRVLFKNINPRDNLLQRRIDKVSERVLTREVRRFNRHERRAEFRDYGIIKKGRTVIDLAANIPVVSSAALNLPPFLASSFASVLGALPAAGGFLSLVAPVVRIGTGTLMFGVKAGIRILSDSDYRTQIQKDMRLLRNDRRELRRTNREDRIVGLVPFPRINPLDNVIMAGLNMAKSEPVKTTIRNMRLNMARNEARRTRLEQRFNKRDELGNLITGVDNVRDLIDKSSIIVGPAGNLGINVVSGLAGLTLGTVFPVVGGPGASIAGGAASYLWNVALDTIGDDYATRVRRDYRRETRRENRQELSNARRIDRAERQFGTTRERPGIVPYLQFGPERNLPSILSILQAGPENVRPELSSRLQLGPSGTPVRNAIEIIRTAISPSSEERRQNRAERRANRPARQDAREEMVLNFINRLRAAINLEPLSKEESSLLLQTLINL